MDAEDAEESVEDWSIWPEEAGGDALAALDAADSMGASADAPDLVVGNNGGSTLGEMLLAATGEAEPVPK